MRNWNINIYKQVRHIIPHFLQKSGLSNMWITPTGLIWTLPSGAGWGISSSSIHLAYIKSFLAGLQSLIDIFSAFVYKTFYDLSITGQVVYLERYLNDKLDPSLRRIYIGDGSLILPPYLYMEIDNNPITLYNKAGSQSPFYLYNKQDFYGQAVFIIYVPSAIPLTQLLKDKIRALVDPRRQAGATYEIQSY